MQTNNRNENYLIQNDPYAPQKDLNDNQQQQQHQQHQQQQQQNVNSGPYTTQQGYSQNNVYIPPPIMTVPMDNVIIYDEDVPIIIKVDDPVIIQEEVVVTYEPKPQPMLGPFERHSMRIKCEKCNLVVDSDIRTLPGPGAQCCSIILCCLCTWPLCCCLVPYCCGDCCRDVYHDCPRCGALIGQTLFNVKD